MHISTGNVVALKIINLDTEDDDVGDIQREVALLTQLRDAPNVTQYYGCYLDGPRVWIVMEYAQGGSVRTLMKASMDGVLEEKYVSVITREVLMALGYLHKSNIIHRDLKAANILVTAAGKVMICDFGVSALLVTASSKRNTLVGTPHWMAPEVAHASSYDTKADIWSLGILIYEMIKGSAPNSHIVDQVKLVQMIPRMKPPRLIEGEGSKELREFVSNCLRELPNDRLTADELSRTKWIKSIAKVPVTTLKDLILRYDAWTKGGGTRASMAGALPWEEDEERDSHPPAEVEDNPWEFDTVRARPSLDLGYPEGSSSLSVDVEDDGLASSTTVRPPPSSKVPPTLRMLFEDETGTPDPFRIPGFDLPLLDTKPPPSPVLSSMSHSPVRGRSALKSPAPDILGEVPETARQSDFVFPPRTSTPRAKSKLSRQTSDDGDNERERLPPLGPGIPLGKSSLPLGAPSTPVSSSNGAARSTPSYREVRASRGLADIEIPGRPDTDSFDIRTEVSTPPIILSSSSPERPVVPERPTISRKRSKSSATGGMPSSLLAGRRDYPSPTPTSGFRFPPPSSLSTEAARAGPSSLSISDGQTGYKRSSPTRAYGSTTSTDSTISPGSHQATHSLDVSVLPRRMPSPAGSLPTPPPLARAYSAAATPDEQASSSTVDSRNIPRKPSLNRLASVAVMENVYKPPSRPWMRNRDSRGGSLTESSAFHGPNGPLPGLKDILKVPTLTSEHRLGMSDLLPPSPSIPQAPRAPASPSPFNFTPIDTGQPHPRPWPHTSSAASSSTTSLSSLSSQMNHSFSDGRVGTSDSSTSFTQSHSRSMSHGGSQSFLPHDLAGPALRPLDFGALMQSHDATHAELAHTVDELAQWLAVVEVGLTHMLDRSTQDTIEEEQELDGPEDDVSVSAYAHAALVAGDPP